MRIKKTHWATKLFLASGVLLANPASAVESKNGGFINMALGADPMTAVADEPGSHAVAGGILIDGQNITTSSAQDAGIKKTEQRPLASYHSIEIDNFPGNVTLQFRKDKKNSAVVTADQAVVPTIKTTVENGILFVGIKESISTRTALQLFLNADEIFSLRVKGVSKVAIENIATDRLRLELDGSGEILAQGNVRELEAIISGSGDLKTGNLVTQQCTVRIDGVGDAAVYVTDFLNAEINGVGDIIYSGNPSKVVKNINGTGDIMPVGK
ncbi:MAG: DUF2807 domain-containing protein [Candidatus Electrothrix sp. EH2]|nr:DUF2807 domain-containing protein [Candidatus Electrothrix sp. EH2]